MPERNDSKVSDTVTVTTDGRTIVDGKKLFEKKHIADTIAEIRSKTRSVTVVRPAHVPVSMRPGR